MTDEITRWFAVVTPPGAEFDAAMEMTMACLRSWRSEPS